MDAAGAAIYVAGDFTSVRPPGAATGEVSRRYVAAFDAATGALLPFAHSFDAPPEVVAGSPDGARIYVGGGFSRVDGQPRAHLAAFDTATGGLLDWAPTPDADVTAMAVAPDGSAVYLGGRFHIVNGAPRSRLAADHRRDRRSDPLGRWRERRPHRDDHHRRRRNRLRHRLFQLPQPDARHPLGGGA